MSELPTGWIKCPFGEVTESITKGSPENDFTYVDIASINNSTKQIDSSKSVPADKAPSRARQHLKTADVIVSMTRPNLNAVAMVPENLNGSIGTTGFDVLRSNEIEPSWLFAHVKSPRFVAEMTNKVQGALYPAVNSKDIRSFEIELPPLNEQKRIVAKLESCESRITAARESLDEVPALLEQYRQSILAAAFRGDLTKDWRAANLDTEPASELLNRLRQERRQRWEETELAKYKAKGKKTPKNWKDKYPSLNQPESEAVEKLPPLPKGWTYQTLDAICDVSRSICYGVIKLGAETPGGIPCLRTSDVRHLRIDTSCVKKISPEIAASYSRTTLQGGEILVNVRGTLGGVATVPISMENWNISREVAMAPILPQIRPNFCAQIIASIYAQQWLTGVIKGVAYSGINISDLKTLPIPIPPYAEQEAINGAVTEALGKISKIENIVQNSGSELNQLTEGLLKKAFAGQLVPQDQSDEPASILLDRIKEKRFLEDQIRKKRPKKKRTSNAPMPKAIPATIQQALEGADSQLSTSDLFAKMGHANDSNSKTVESFLLQLRSAIEDGSISKTRKDEEDYFSLNSR